MRGAACPLSTRGGGQPARIKWTGQGQDSGVGLDGTPRGDALSGPVARAGAGLIAGVALAVKTLRPNVQVRSPRSRVDGERLPQKRMMDVGGNETAARGARAARSAPAALAPPPVGLLSQRRSNKTSSRFFSRVRGWSGVQSHDFPFLRFPSPTPNRPPAPRAGDWRGAGLRGVVHFGARERRS